MPRARSAASCQRGCTHEFEEVRSRSRVHDAHAAHQSVHFVRELPSTRGKIVQGQSHTVLAACDVTLIASGTATLEAALFKRPMVIAYNMNWLSWQIMRRKQLKVGLEQGLGAVVPGR